VQPDQIEDVGDHLDLLRQRVELLPDAAGTAPVNSGAAPTCGADGDRPGRSSVKVTLRGCKPPIWRRLEVPSEITLQRLHRAIQETFRWPGCHLWVFSTPDGDYGMADRELGHRSAASKPLQDVAPRSGDRIRYTYHLGDDWQHEILVEDVQNPQPGVPYPRCIAGRRACPPEDCGGARGYQEPLEILTDPDHDEHADRLKWLGLAADEFDPNGLDLDEVNQALSGKAPVPHKR